MLVDEHCRGEPGETAMVQMSCAPVVLTAAIAAAAAARGVFLGEVVEESRFGGVGCADYVLEIALWIPLDLLLGVLVASSCDQDGHVDDETAEGGDCRLEAR